MGSANSFAFAIALGFDGALSADGLVEVALLPMSDTKDEMGLLDLVETAAEWQSA